MQKRTTILAGIALFFLAGLFACAIALLIVPGVQLLPLYRIEPEDILPAKETLLLLHAPTAEDLEHFKKNFPALDDVISDTPLDAVAIVRSDAEDHSIGFIRRDKAWDGNSCEVGSYRIIRAETFPCPVAAALNQFLSAGPRLSDDRAWRSLGSLPKESWTFLKLEAFPAAASLQQVIFGSMAFGTATHVLLFPENEMTVVRSWPTSPLASLSNASALVTPLEHPEMVFSFGNLADVNAELDHNLTPDDRIILEGLLLQQLENFAGPNASLEHGVLPLIAQRSELHVGKTASGNLSLLLSGTAEQGVNTVEHLEALHRSFALRHPDTELLRFAFDDGRFPFETLRLKEEDILEEEQIRGWNVRISRDNADKTMFITAQSDRQIALSNDPEALRRFLMEEGKEIPLPAGKKTLIGRTVAGMLVPNAWLGMLGTAETGKSIISIEQTGELRTVRTDQLKM